MKKAIIILLLVTLCLLCIAPDLFAGAGGTRGKGKGYGAIAVIVLVVLCLPILVGSAYYKHLLHSRSKQDASNVIRNAVLTDPLWNRKKMLEHARTVFRTVQELWSKNDAEGVSAYLHPEYEKEFLGKLQNNINDRLYNRISDIQISSAEIVLAKNYRDNDKDMFVVFFSGTMNDEMVTESGTVVKKQGDGEDNSKRAIDEYWQFLRKNDEWLLQNITKDMEALKEASVDEESKQAEEVLVMTGSKFEDYEEVIQSEKRRYISRAGILGFIVALLGYALYVAIGFWIFS